jgi:hypothetical protein
MVSSMKSLCADVELSCAFLGDSRNDWLESWETAASLPAVFDDSASRGLPCCMRCELIANALAILISSIRCLTEFFGPRCMFNLAKYPAATLSSARFLSVSGWQGLWTVKSKSMKTATVGTCARILMAG